jgi:hypothetical protein
VSTLIRSSNFPEFSVRRLLVFILTATLALAAGCGGGSSKSTSTSSPSSGASSGSNILSISVDGGPTANETGGSIYHDAAFASATVCVPGSTSSCVTVDHLLVDTGSYGLRVLESEIDPLNLPAINASNGSPAYDCVSFADGSYLWGSVQQASVSLGAETASNVPIEVVTISSSGVPASCSNGSTMDENTQASLGANGILGVGLEPTDCFSRGASPCDPGSGLSTPPSGAYYTCSGAPCSPAFISKASQVTNPVVLFATDNNGVIVELPAVSGSAATVSGSLIFGIGTESNNQVSGATVFTLTCDDFTTKFDNNSYGITNAGTCAGPGSFIDSGSNGLYFPNAANIPVCPNNTPAGNLSSYYCPTSTENLSATNIGANGASKTTSFSVANAETLLTTTSTSSDAAFSGLAGLNPSGAGFDWGLPFFYGVNVYSSIDGQSVPSGQPAAPWWAY